MLELVDVGQSLVTSDRKSGEDDYRTWYRIILESTAGAEAQVEWTIGTGEAPAGTAINCA